MKVIKLDTRYLLIRHWWVWYLVKAPYRNKTLWIKLSKSRETIDE